MVEERADRIVCGGGVAGLYAGLLLAEQGLDVVVLERRAEVSAPIRCGGISPRSWISESFSSRFESAILHDDESIKISNKNNSDEDDIDGFHAMIFDREILERELAVSLVQASGRLETRQTVREVFPEADGWRVSTLGPVGSHDFRATSVVIADGVDRTLLRRLGRLPPAGPTELRMMAFATHRIKGHLTPWASLGTDSRTLVFPNRPGRGTVSVTDTGPGSALLARLATAEGEAGLDRRLQVGIGGRIHAPPRAPIAQAGLVVAGSAAGGGDPLFGFGLAHALLSAEYLANADQTTWWERDTAHWHRGLEASRDPSAAATYLSTAW